MVLIFLKSSRTCSFVTLCLISYYVCLQILDIHEKTLKSSFYAFHATFSMESYYSYFVSRILLHNKLCYRHSLFYLFSNVINQHLLFYIEIRSDCCFISDKPLSIDNSRINGPLQGLIGKLYYELMPNQYLSKRLSIFQGPQIYLK